MRSVRKMLLRRHSSLQVWFHVSTGTVGFDHCSYLTWAFEHSEATDTWRITLMPSLRGIMTWNKKSTVNLKHWITVQQIQSVKIWKKNKYLLYTWICRDKLVKFSERQSIVVCGGFKINLGFEQWVVHTYDTVWSQQVVIQDKVVVVDVIILVSINEDHVKLLTCSSQFLEGTILFQKRVPQIVILWTPKKAGSALMQNSSHYITISVLHKCILILQNSPLHLPEDWYMCSNLLWQQFNCLFFSLSPLGCPRLIQSWQ